ncbi:MAG: hypothetical protein ACQEP1_03365 [Nanobdellota archaeon]
MSYILTVIIAYLGILVGVFLSHTSKEEKDQIKRWLTLARFGLPVLIASITFVYFTVNIWISVLMTFFVGLTLYHTEVPYQLLYIFLGGLIYIVHLKEELFFIVSSLIFILGIVTGPLESDHKNKLSKDIVKVGLNTSPFLLLSILPFIVI